MELQKLNQVIENFKKPYILNKYQKKNYIIVKKFIDELQKRRFILVDLIKKDNEYCKTNFNIENTLKAISQEYDNLEEKSDRKFGVGNIVAITNGDIYLHIDLIIKAIISNCRIAFILLPTMFNFNLYIVSIIQEILKNENLDETLISAVHSITYKKELVKNKKYIDCIIVNKDYEEYTYFLKNIDSKIIYLDYGNINIYTDSNKFETEVEKIVEVANNMDMDIYRYNIDDLEEFFKNEINNFVFNTVVFFSDDIKKCMRFYEAIKGQNVFINELNLNKIEIGLEIRELQFEKNLVIKNSR